MEDDIPSLTSGFRIKLDSADRRVIYREFVDGEFLEDHTFQETALTSIDGTTSECE